MFKTHWAFWPGDKTVEFERQPDVVVAADGTFTLQIDEDSIYSLSTLTTAAKGTVPTPPPPSLFPTAHVDNFDACPLSSEAAYFADQNGIFECVACAGRAGTCMQQKVPQKPITWGGDIRPHSLIGHRDSKNMSINADALILVAGASTMFGVRMQGTDNSQGLLWSLDTTGSWWVHTAISDVNDASKAIAHGTTPSPVTPGVWYTYRLDVNGSSLNAWINGVPVITNLNVAKETTSGHGLIGTRFYNEFTMIDNFAIYSAYTTCGATPLVAGAPISVAYCSSEVGLETSVGTRWDFTTLDAPHGWTGVFSLRSDPTLCLASQGAANMLVLATCDKTDPNQIWSWKFDGESPDGERTSSIFHPNNNLCLDVMNNVPDIGAQMDAWACNKGGNQNFFYDWDAGEIASETLSVCAGVC